MKLELTDEEVVVYMTMKQALVHAQEKILELEEALANHTKKTTFIPAEPRTTSTRAPETEEREDYKPGNPTANLPPIRNIGDWQMYCANPIPLRNKGSMWTEWENSVIHQAVGKDAAIFKIPYIAKMLGRTIVAIEMQAKKLKFEVVGNKIRYPL